MTYIVVGVLNEVRPVWYYVLAAVLFVLSQLDYFLLNKVICQVGNEGGSPIANSKLNFKLDSAGHVCKSRRLLRRHGAGNRGCRRPVSGMEEHH